MIENLAIGLGEVVRVATLSRGVEASNKRDKTKLGVPLATPWPKCHWRDCGQWRRIIITPGVGAVTLSGARQCDCYGPALRKC